jgi:asparagine synthase (glutamine-hydrolysing)
MCGIAGIYYFNTEIKQKFSNHQKILQLLYHRGPDNQSFHSFNNCTLYHSRLSIVDVTVNSNQPFLNNIKNLGLVYNGEIFNYKSFTPNAKSDVEVLFNLLQSENKHCLYKLNGFFSFAFFNKENNSLLIARDRYGVKPLYYFKDNDKFAFASELKPLMELIGKQEINPNQLYTYLRLNYCSGNETIFKNVYRLLPGQLIEINNKQIEVKTWYQIPKQKNIDTLQNLLDDSVKLRLNADVPVGTFLSGGVDSSIISAIAKKHKPDLHTFSIGFKNEKYFDETNYSEIVAKYINSNHHVFKLSEDDFINNIDLFLKCIDEPFADSSAFNFYMLSKFTKQYVKVALSGDGADEIFKGYNKHRATFLNLSVKHKLISNIASPLLSLAGASRNSKLGNVARQLKKFKAIQNLNENETFKFLASISTEKDLENLLHNPNSNYFNDLFICKHENFEAEDLLDLKIVLADDMLVKADRFSMQHGIEIRNPFLDYRVVEFAFNLSNDLKINSHQQKIILHKEFGDLLPKQIFERSKKGFELPLQKWLIGSLNTQVKNDWLNKEKIKDEGFLNFNEIEKLLLQLNSKNPGDSAAKLWAIIVFENWLYNFKEYIKK